ncbi:MAG: hypothetical protein IKE68_05960 [Solobacterium sp.]|nr:hypothetical protein [Solobacterium sp.]
MDNRMIVYIDPEENNLAGKDDALRALDEIFTDNGYESLVFDGKTYYISRRDVDVQNVDYIVELIEQRVEGLHLEHCKVWELVPAEPAE